MNAQSREEFEKLNADLNDDERLRTYAEPLDNYTVSWLPKVLGAILVSSGDLLYGRTPSYLKFRAVEIIARVPYHSWSSAAYTLLTLIANDEQRAVRLSRVAHFSRHAQDNETMHVVAISHIAKNENAGGFIRGTLIPIAFAFIYFWASYVLYLILPKWSYELNYLFEQHAFNQYDLFLKTNHEQLDHKPMESEFLAWYGRTPRTQYEFFRSVRNDEIIHRNQSIAEISAVDDTRIRMQPIITALVLLALGLWIF